MKTMFSKAILRSFFCIVILIKNLFTNLTEWLEFRIKRNLWYSSHDKSSLYLSQGNLDHEFLRKRLAFPTIEVLLYLEFLSSTLFFDFETRFSPRGGGGGGYLTKFYTGRLRPEVQPLTLSYTILAEKVRLLYTFYWKKVPLSHTYFRKSCSSFHVVLN